MKLPVIILITVFALLPCHALDREAFTFTHYDLNVQVDPSQQRLGVRGKITLRNDSSSPQKNLSLQISSSLDWRSIHLNGKPLQFISQPFTSDIDHTGSLSEAIVTLPAAIPPKGTVDLEIGYEGVIPLDTRRLTRIGGTVEQAKHSDWDQIGKSFTAVRGIGYVAWYPIATESASLSEENDVFETLGRWINREQSSDFQVNLCVSNDRGELLDVQMNDVPAGVPPGSSGGVTGDTAFVCHQHSFLPLRQAIPTFVGGNNAVLNRPEIEIKYRASERSAAENYALAAEVVTPFITEWFGAATKQAEVVELLDPQAAPFESGTFLLTPLENAADSRLEQMTAVHQLSHAAFSSARLWIYEGLAHFAQALYRERQDGLQAALDFMNLRLVGLTDLEKSLSAEQGSSEAANESLINTAIPDLYRGKAMYVWWMLRDMVGEPALKKALAQYRPEQEKDPAYMQKLLEAPSKRDLEWFFDDWVYRDKGLPDFRVESAFTRKLVNEGYVVTITIEDLGAAGAEVPVTLKLQGGVITKRLLVPGKGKATIRLEAATAPLEVVINDGSVPESDLSNNSYKIPAPAK